MPMSKVHLVCKNSNRQLLAARQTERDLMCHLEWTRMEVQLAVAHLRRMVGFRGPDPEGPSAFSSSTGKSGMLDAAALIINFRKDI
jgi:hypothetical protein